MEFEFNGEVYTITVVDDLGGPLIVVIGRHVWVVSSGDLGIDKEHARAIVDAMH